MLSRRTAIASALAASAATGFQPHAFGQTPQGQTPGRFSAFNILYRTDPARIARVLPPPLTPDDDPVVQIDCMVTSAPGGVFNVMAPEDYFETAIHLAAKFEGKRGLYQLSVGLNGEWGRSSGREGPGWVKKEGVVRLDWQDKAIEAAFTRRGARIITVKAMATDGPAHPRLWMREFGWGAFLFRHRLDPDWRKGLVDAEYGVELWRLGGNDQGFPSEDFPDEPGVPRALDPKSIEFAFPDPTVIDSWAEFPVQEIIGGSFSGRVGQRLQRPQRQGSSQQTIYGARAKFLAKVDATAFEPFALFSYDRPATANRAATPSGWPSASSAWRLTTAEIDAYKARKSVELEGSAVIVDGAIAPELHRQVLPDLIEPGPEATVRFLALDITTSGVSTVPFKELWMLARCQYMGSASWYALSHIVGQGGDVLIGRETFGYPSKTGSISIAARQKEVGFTGDRLLRQFVQMTGRAGDGADFQPEKTTLVGIAARFNRPDTDDLLRARLVSQPWTIRSAGPGNQVTGVKLGLSREAAPGRIGLPDPWFELQPSKVLRAWSGPIMIERMPGSKGVPVPEYRRFWMERMDGTTSAMEQPSTSTFLINRKPA